MRVPWNGPALLTGLACLLALLAWANSPAPAADKGDDQKPAEGKPAPDIELPATQIDKVLPDKKDAKTLHLKDLQGKNVVLYFFPKAMTKG
jgi:thioredoxin-dependent peroxiredoxin